MKKKALLSSVLVIALCLCLIAGSTFALFTDSTEFNIAVTSGDVEILSTAEVVQRWSAEGPVEEHSDKYLKDENGSYYKHIERTDTFTNGGTADVDKNTGTLVIDKITPGDKVDVRINTKNLGNVAFRYRYIVSVLNDKGLATGMVLTTHSGEEYEAVKSFTSEWFDVVEAGATVPSKDFSLELPVYAGNEYQSEKTAQEDGRPAGDISVEYKITVEAVQGNAVTTEELTTVEVYPTVSAYAAAIANGGLIDGKGETIDGEWFELASDKVILKDVTLNNTSSDDGTANVYTFSKNVDLVLEEGATISASSTAFSASGIYAWSKSGKITIEEGACVKASGAPSYAVQVMGDYTGGEFELYVAGIDSIQVENDATMIMVSGAAKLTIYVPDEATENYYNNALANGLIADDNTCTITIIVRSDNT